MKQVAEYKKQTVNDFQNLMKEYPIIGVINMENMPAAQLQNMREQLRNTVIMKMSRKKLIALALENTKTSLKNIEKLEEHLAGMPALIFTKDNPFKLFKIIKKNKSKAPAKAGQTAPNDVLVKAGPTPFPPGPIISELGQLGLQTAVEDGKVTIKEDKVVAKEGDVIDEKTANLLTRLDIHPMEIGLDLVAVYENGTIFTKKVLDVDEEAFWSDLLSAAAASFNLALDLGYFTTETTERLVQRAYGAAKVLVLDNDILTKDFVGDTLAKAEAQASTLASTANIETPAKEKQEEATTETAEEKTAEKPEQQEKETQEQKNDQPEEPSSKQEEQTAVEDTKTKETKPDSAQEKQEAPAKEENDNKAETKEAAEEKADEQVNKMVEATKKQFDPTKKDEAPTAEKLVKDLNEEDKPDEVAKEAVQNVDTKQVQDIVQKIQKGEKITEVPTAHELAKRKEQSS